MSAARCNLVHADRRNNFTEHNTADARARHFSRAAFRPGHPIGHAIAHLIESFFMQTDRFRLDLMGMLVTAGLYSGSRRQQPIYERACACNHAKHKLALGARLHRRQTPNESELIELAGFSVRFSARP